jgi:hypothetical protein
MQEGEMNKAKLLNALKTVNWLRVGVISIGGILLAFLFVKCGNA